MAKHARRAKHSAHPGWCVYKWDGSDDDHDPHVSPSVRVDADFPADLEIEAYLLKPKKVKTRHPEEPFAALVFHDPGNERPTEITITSWQLRRLYEALSKLVHLGVHT